MKCAQCACEEIVKFGFFCVNGNRIQRFKCKECGETFSKDQNKPFEDLRLAPDKIKQIVSFLCEGIGIRASARLANVHRDTVLSILKFAGNKAVEIFNTHIVNLNVREIQLDELYAFVRKKQKNCDNSEINYGDQYTYLALDPLSKLILSYHTGKRDADNTNIFVDDLTNRVNRERYIEITSDGFKPYEIPIIESFYEKSSYSQVVKNFQWLQFNKEHRTDLPATEYKTLFGERKQKSIYTSHVERLNLTVRTFSKRFTRRSIGYSKKLEYLKHAVALFCVYYNFCCVHSTIKMTPAMGAGLVLRKWTVDDIIK